MLLKMLKMTDKRQYIIEQTSNQLVLKVTRSHNFSIDDIATTCSISKKTIYKFFKNKHDLFEESYQFLRKKLIDNLYFKAKDSNNVFLLDEVIGEVYKTLCIYTLIYKNTQEFYINFEKEISKIYQIIETITHKTSDACFRNAFIGLMCLMCNPYKNDDLEVLKRYDFEKMLQSIIKLTSDK